MTARDQCPENRVLLLPATRRDGEVLCELLGKNAVPCLVCTHTEQVVAELTKGAATLVLTDIALADAQGHRIVDALLQQPRWSDLPVILLRMENASEDVEKLLSGMSNVTVLERPTSSRTLLSAIHSSLRARKRQYEIRDHIQALADAEHALRQSDRRKDEFLAMLAHELRNPLAPIRTAAELLPRIVPRGDERVDATLSMVKRQVGQLSRLVDDLLDVSRVTQGRIELQKETLDLRQIVAQALESVQPYITEKAHRVLLQASSAPLHVFGDRVRLVQCVSNLLSNAVKYTDPQGEIQVRLRSEPDVAVLAVQDNGVGISAELLPRIFDLFVQSERSIDRSQGGLGIGLSVVKQLVEMHSGAVTAHSAGAGLGTTFELRLPLAAQPAAIRSAEPGSAASRRRILIVDDNRDAAESLSQLLQLEGHEVRADYDAEQALQTAQSYAPDVVLLDIGLPTMNGYEVARRLREQGNVAYLVALTGYGQPEDVRRAKEAGFDAHMVKPVDADLLLQTLRTARRPESDLVQAG